MFLSLPDFFSPQISLSSLSLSLPPSHPSEKSSAGNENDLFNETVIQLIHLPCSDRFTGDKGKLSDISPLVDCVYFLWGTRVDGVGRGTVVTELQSVTYMTGRLFLFLCLEYG